MSLDVVSKVHCNYIKGQERVNPFLHISYQNPFIIWSNSQCTVHQKTCRNQYKIYYQTTTPPLPPKSTQIFIVKMFSDKCVTLSPRSMLPPLPTVRVFLGVGCLAMIDRLLRYLLAWWCCSTPQQSVAAEISRIWLSLLQRLMLLIAAVSQAIKAL